MIPPFGHKELYQPLTYRDYVDLNQRMSEWEQFYNINRSHGAPDGKAAYEALNSMLSLQSNLSQRV